MTAIALATAMLLATNQAQTSVTSGFALRPMFVQIHPGGAILAYPLRSGRYDFDHKPQVVYGPHDTFNDVGTVFYIGPGLRYARTGGSNIEVYDLKGLIGSWKLPDPHVVAWWDLPVVASRGKVYALQPHGRTQALDIPAKNLRTAATGRSGYIYALYDDGAKGRILRSASGKNCWTPWIQGEITFASTPDELLILSGVQGPTYSTSYKASLYAYSYKTCVVRALRHFSPLEEASFDDPWIHTGHLLSVSKVSPAEAKNPKPYPYETLVYDASNLSHSVGLLKGGWTAHGFDPARQEFLVLSIWYNMGGELDLRSIDGTTSRHLASQIDAVFISPPLPYSPLVDDLPAKK